MPPSFSSKTFQLFYAPSVPRCRCYTGRAVAPVRVLLRQQRCCTGAQPRHGCLAPSSPRPGRGSRPRGTRRAAARSPSRDTRLPHECPGAAQRARLGCSPFSSSPAELGGGRGTQPRCTQPTLTVSPLLLILLFPSRAVPKGGEPATPSLHTSPQSPFHQLRHIRWVGCQSKGRGCAGGAEPHAVTLPARPAAAFQPRGSCTGKGP